MTKGRKPKPPHLHLVEGTHRRDRHGDEKTARKAVEKARAVFGPLVKPNYLKGDAGLAWKRWIQPASWLDCSREPSAIAFCELWAEFRFNPAGFPASKHTQMRGFLADLGLSDQRNRPPAVEGEDEDDEFFR